METNKSNGIDPLEDLFVAPELDAQGVNVSFTMPPGGAAGEWSIWENGKSRAAGKIPGNEGNISFFAAIPECTPWSTHAPSLYTLRLQIDIGKKSFEREQTFGVYKIEVRDEKLYFNRRRLYLKGVIRGLEAHDHKSLEKLPEFDYYAKYIRTAKAYGFNFARFHSTVPPESWFAAADQLGFFTHVEIKPFSYQKDHVEMFERPELVGEEFWRQTILRLRNHPSVLVYCMGNEIDHPGINPEVAKISRLTKKLDPNRLFLDTCSRGEYDRTGVDIDVQHLGYFAPFGRNANMFDSAEHSGIYGSCRGHAVLTAQSQTQTVRHIHRPWPLLAHEICHYIALPDIDKLERDLVNYGAPMPWWIGELKKLRAQKKLERQYPLMLAASRNYQRLWWKQCMESVRKSPVLHGFHMLQLSDTDRYENGNGVLDIFDNPKGVPPEQFLPFNADTILLADLPRRCFAEKEELTIPVLLSHFDHRLNGEANLRWRLSGGAGSGINFQGGMDNFDLNREGLRMLCTLKIKLPALQTPEALKLEIRLADRVKDGVLAQNSWNLWVYPDRPEEVLPAPFVSLLTTLNLHKRYPHFKMTERFSAGRKLILADNFDRRIMRHLAEGGDALMFYRIAENRDRSAPRARYYWPSTQDRFKGIIWDRGHNSGAFMRSCPVWKSFPHDGFVDFSFARLIDDCDKIDLSDFPVPLEPIMEGVDKATRDRFDVYTFKMSELQPRWTMRRFAYLFELMVGPGRLLVSAFNFKGIEQGHPEVCALFEGLLKYTQSDEWRPAARIEPDAMERYLLEKGRAPRIKERTMTLYWQEDATPVETKEFWEDSERYLRQND